MTPYPLSWPDHLPKPGGRYLDIIGHRYGRLTVLAVVDKVNKSYVYLCRCDCGEQTRVRGYHLRDGRVVSCGCKKRENGISAGNAQLEHGESNRGGRAIPSPEYRAWKGMKERCLSPKHKSYSRYGGRGIKVCDRWLHGDGELGGFECFLVDIGRKPTTRHSLDRFPNNDGNYEPGNVRWATPSEQHWTQRKPRQTVAEVSA